MPDTKTDLALRRLVLPYLLPGLLLPTLAGCKPGYSPNTYAATAAQQEAAVQRGIVIGVRQVQISTSGAVGAAAGGAVGGLAGAQVPGGSVGTALGAIGGTLVGGVGGAAAAQAVGETKGWEYIVQESGDKLVSVTQTSKTALPIGQHVLVIADSQQARIVPDYTVQPAPPPAAKPAVPDGTAAPEINVSPLLPAAGDLAPLQLAPLDMGGAATVPPTLASPASNPAPAPAAPDAAATPAPASSASPAPATPPATSATPPAATPPAQTTPAAPASTPAPLPAVQKAPN